MRHRRERWLHTRITEDLEDALKREARRLRSPVSLVVRNVLEAALDLVDDVVDVATGPVDAGLPGRRRGRPERKAAVARGEASLDDVYAWQEVLLNRGASCARCACELGAGASAHRGLRDEPGGPPVFLCPACVDRLRAPRARDARDAEGKEIRS